MPQLDLRTARVMRCRVARSQTGPARLRLVRSRAATACGDDKPVKPITPAEAAKKVNEKVTVEMVVEGRNTPHCRDRLRGNGAFV